MTTVYGITLDYKVRPVQLGSLAMMECREVQMTEEQAVARAAVLKIQAAFATAASCKPEKKP